jgi:hypothetical protein
MDHQHQYSHEVADLLDLAIRVRNLFTPIGVILKGESAAGGDATRYLLAYFASRCETGEGEKKRWWFRHFRAIVVVLR